MAITLYGNKQAFIQVVQTVVTSASTQANTEPAWQDLTGYSVTITPSSSSNKILLNMHFGCVSSSTNYIGFRFLRNGTVIAVGDLSGSKPQVTFRCMRESDTNHNKATPSMTFLDSPSSTSAVTYQLQWQAEGSGTIYLNRTQFDSTTGVVGGRSISTFTATEVAYA